MLSTVAFRSATKCRHTAEPINPAPPVTRTFIALAASLRARASKAEHAGRGNHRGCPLGRATSARFLWTRLMPPGEIGLQRVSEAREAFPMDRQIAVCVGISWWKQRRVGDFLAAAGGKPVFRRGVAGAVSAALARNGAIGVWATREPPGLAEAAALHGIALIRLEDGFIRSVGLGSDFLPPASLVFDTAGIYCDPRRESDLERLLRETDFDAALLARARRLIDRLIAGGVTKYNLGVRGPGGLQPRIAWPRGRRRILVPGQVEDDLSVRAGCSVIGGNLGLLARVR